MFQISNKVLQVILAGDERRAGDLKEDLKSLQIDLLNEDDSDENVAKAARYYSVLQVRLGQNAQCE